MNPFFHAYRPRLRGLTPLWLVLWTSLAVFLAGCPEDDADGDGYTEDTGDCNDSDSSINPDAVEVCDGLDNNCNSLPDDDTDNDGFGPCDDDCVEGDSEIYPGAPETCNEQDDNCDGQIDEGLDLDNDGYLVCTGDCDDENPNVYPGAVEECNSLDEDCDGVADEDFDLDGDGYAYCTGDCDGLDPTVYPGAEELCDGLDNDCNLISDDGIDADGDGFTGCITGEGAFDCNDGDPTIHPEADEICDGLDQNCDESIDEGLDEDGDGYSACATEGGPVDCDDGDSRVNPGAEERCNNIDDDCDGEVDNGVDADGDGYSACEGGSGQIDCDDTNPQVNPGAVESCNQVDDNCDGAVDEGFDMDGDGVPSCSDCDDGDPAIYPGAEERCNGLDDDCDGAAEVDGDEDGDSFTRCTGGDCDDSDPQVFPGAEEVCDGIGNEPRDNNCDGQVDEGFDVDADGYSACVDDCDDGAAEVHPGAEELCNGVDDDCDGVIDGIDGDQDGYVDDGCGGDDCDDGDPSVNPGVDEVCSDGVDNNCDGLGCSLLGTKSLGEANSIFRGASVETWLGRSVALAGDLNGDGFDDLLMGARYDDEGGEDAGAVYVVYGPVDGEVSIDTAGAKLLGTVGGEHVGDVVSGAGDVNNDGYDDILIGAPENLTNGEDAGAVYFLYGPVEGTLSLTEADAIFLGEYPGDKLGTSLSSAGHVNGDEYGDVLLGAMEGGTEFVEDGGSAGVVYLLHGPIEGSYALTEAAARFDGEHERAFAGRSVAGAGDINNDGFDDIVIGANGDDGFDSNAGAAYVIYGPVEGLHWLVDADAKLTGELASDYAGYSVDIAGDVNGDGYDDILVGAYGDDTVDAMAGAAYVIHGPITGIHSLSEAAAKFIGEAASDYAGRPVSAAGDVNDDGLADILVGAYRNDAIASSAGAAYVVLAPFDGQYFLADADARLLGETALANAGYALDGGGDFNGDGIDDVIIGAFGDGTAGTDSGSAYVFFGGEGL